jgi:hypothetical protein
MICPFLRARLNERQAATVTFRSIASDRLAVRRNAHKQEWSVARPVSSIHHKLPAACLASKLPSKRGLQPTLLHHLHDHSVRSSNVLPCRTRRLGIESSVVNSFRISCSLTR